MRYKLRWFRIFYTFVLMPIVSGWLWSSGDEPIVIWLIVLNTYLILGYQQPEYFRK